MEHPHSNALVRFTATFEGQAIATIEWDNILLFLPQQIGASLEFADPGRFVKKLNEYGLEEGRHTVRFTNGNLAALKAALGPDVIDPRTPSLVLLTEAGLYRALMRSRAKNAEPFQEWLASEVLPQLRKTGSYALTKTMPAPAAVTVRFELLRELHRRGSLTPAGYAAELGTLLKSDGAAELQGTMVDELVQLAVPARSGAQRASAPAISSPEHADRPPIARLRLRHGLTPSGAGAKCNINHNTWSAYELGHRDIKASTLQRLMNALEATPEERTEIYEWIGRGGQ